MPRVNRTTVPLRPLKPVPKFETQALFKKNKISEIPAQELKLDPSVTALLKRCTLTYTRYPAPKVSATAYKVDPRALTDVLADKKKTAQFVYGAMQHAGGHADLLAVGTQNERSIDPAYFYDDSNIFRAVKRADVQGLIEADVLKGRKEPEVSTFRAALKPVVEAFLSDPTTRLFRTSYFDDAHTRYSAVVSINEKTGIVRVLKDEFIS